MTLASDRQPDSGGLSPTSRRMLALRDAVFSEWEARARATLEEARLLSHPILIDTLPAFYENIAQALTPGYPRPTGTDGTTLASEHGGERARITGYDHEAVIGEYQLFRWAIFDVLEREGVALTTREVLAINASIDAGIKEAISGFILVHSALRERFAAALTHDLRGPLGAASTALELIMMSDDPATMKSFASKALDNVHRMNHMIHELLSTMSFHSGERIALQLSAFDIADVVREVQADTAARHGAGIQASGAFVRGWWDRQAMRRALENMVGNAVKYGREASPVSIRADTLHGRLVLSVHNEGEPIPAAEQEDIFQMYRRAEAARLTRQPGWGIGLPYVRAVAESHGGSVGIDSSAERGTTFTMDVPIDCRPLANAPTPASA